MEEVFETINTLSDNIIKIISDETIIKPIVEISSDVLDTSIPAFKLVLNITYKIRLLKFKSFLEGIYSECKNININGSELKDKLIKLSKKKIFNDYIIHTYESAVNSKSIKNTSILGCYLAKNAFLKGEIKIEHFILCNALRELTDTETSIFVYLFDKVRKIDNLEYLNPNNINDPIYDIYSMQLVIEQLKNIRIVNRGVGGFDCIEQFGVCIFSELTHTFYNLLKENKIY